MFQQPIIRLSTGQFATEKQAKIDADLKNIALWKRNSDYWQRLYLAQSGMFRIAQEEIKKQKEIINFYKKHYEN